MHNRYFQLGFTAVLLVILASAAFAQTTELTYQGKLNDSGIAATGNYDLRFRLFDDVVAGSQQGPTLTASGVTVTGGIFTVHLDFGAQFTGAPRFLQIGVKPAGSPNPFTDLNPRQPITSSPYSVRSLSATTADTADNSTQLGGIPSGGFIQNTTSPQTGTNFNISGNGTLGGGLSADSVNSATQYDIANTPVLSAPGNANTFVGLNTGLANTTGGNGTFVGNAAGQSNTTGFRNSFFGTSAGKLNTTGSSNSFFGVLAGGFNSTGNFNSFFGDGAGFVNTASANSFFGANSGLANTTGNNNSFFGLSSGSSNTTGIWNSFFGSGAGSGNTTGSFNAFYGFNAGNANTTAIDNSFFGQGAGFKNTIGQDNTFIGLSLIHI